MKGSRKGTTKFAIKVAGNAEQAQVAGSFSQWKPIAMARRKDGIFAATVPAANGTHEYKFIVDGRWINDPDNNFFAVTPYGTANSVAEIK